MADLPLIDLIVITYDRFDEIQRTIEALETRLIYPRDRLRYLVADDFTPGNYRQKLSRTMAFKNINYEFVPDNRENGGWGRNVNRALAYSTAPYILQIEDDYILTKELDLISVVACMDVKPEIGMMRFRGTAGDYLVYHQMEADISRHLPDYREGMGVQGKLTYFLIDSGSPGLYIYSHGMHLKRRSFHEWYGKYREGLKLGHCEESFAHQVKDKMREDIYSPVICIQPEWVINYLDHIGISRQHTELDKERIVT